MATSIFSYQPIQVQPAPKFISFMLSNNASKDILSCYGCSFGVWTSIYHGWREGLPSRKKCSKTLNHKILATKYPITQNHWEPNPIPSRFWDTARLTPVWVRVCIYPHWCETGSISKTARDRIWLSTILSNTIFGHSDFVHQCLGTFFCTR